MPPAPVASGCSAQPRATSRHLEVGASRPASDQLCRVTQLLRAPLPASAVAVGCVSLGAGLLSQVEAKRAEPLPQKKRNAKNMNTTENLIQTELSPAPAQPVNQLVKPLRFPAQPQEWKIVSLRECPTPLELQLCDTPEQAAAYWRAHIRQHPCFNPECECFVVLMLNTRRRVKGHYLVSIGTMDTIHVHPREVFRLAIMASAAALILIHNLCVAAHKLCYVERRFMCSDRLAALTLARVPRPKESYV